MHPALELRRRERERLLDIARAYVERLRKRIDVRVAVVAGSVARGDFNVWSDIDMVIVSDELPADWLDRLELLDRDARDGVQAVGYTTAELREAALWRRNALLRDAAVEGVPLVGDLAALRPAA